MQRALRAHDSRCHAVSAVGLNLVVSSRKGPFNTNNEGMECTPARSSSSLSVHRTPSVLQSTPVSHPWTPESGYCSPGGRLTDTSFGFSCSTSPFSGEDASCSSSFPHSSSVPGLSPVEEQPRVDFLKGLQFHMPAVCKVLRCLTPRELSVVCRTSSVWRRLCLSLPEQALRWRQYLKRRRDLWESSRENLHCGRQEKKPPSLGLPLAESNANVEAPGPAVQGDGAVGPRSRHDIYAQEAQTLKEGEWHLPCPLCSYPSRVAANGTAARCKSPACGYQFCPKCRRDSHLPKPCTAISMPTNPRTKKHLLIGSNYSKKQLRRL